MKVEFKKLYPDAQLPKKAHESDAGYDLYAYIPADEQLDRYTVLKNSGTGQAGRNVWIQRGKVVLVKAGFGMCLPPGYEAQIRPRSGLAIKCGITVVNAPGTIDSSYRGPVCVGLINLGDFEFNINNGDRIAQLVIQQLPEVECVEVAELTPATERGEAGFGSTGK